MTTADISWLYTIVILGGALCAWWYYYNRKLNLPPGPTSLPIVGYLPFIGKEPWKTFNNLGKIYGNTFSVYLGRTLVVILNDVASIKEALPNPAVLFRPENLFSVIPNDLGFTSSNGHEWAEQRRFTFKVMKKLGFGKSKWEHLLKEEVEDFLTVLEASGGEAIDITLPLISSMNNNVWSLAFGKRLPSDHPTRKSLDHCVEVIPYLLPQMGLTAFFTSIRKVFERFHIYGYATSNKDTTTFNDIFKIEVLKCIAANTEGEDIYVDEYIKEIGKHKSSNLDHFFNENSLVANLKALFLAATDTIMLSVQWLLLAMAAFPDKQQKIHHELDDFVASGEDLSWQQRYKLVYTCATIMECQRWRTLNPLNLLRIANEDTTIGGYDIPKGTYITANFWSAHNDERYWKHPEKFIPERFLEENGSKLVSNPESYVPFSIGKRNCPGELVANMSIFIYLTSIMLKFKILPPSDGQTINFDGFFCINYQPVERKLRFLPKDEFKRLPKD